jgi:winged helix DNA-binding protein
VTPERLLARRLARQWLAHQDTADAAASDPAEVVAHFGAVQAQEYGQALWAVGLRCAGATAAAIEAAIDRGAILRTWPMRSTIHLVPARDARWMLELLAGRRIKAMAGVYAKIGLTPDVLGRAAEVAVAALSGGRHLRRRDLYARLTEAGLDCSASPHGGRGGHILGYLSMTGLICFGPRAGAQPTFALLGEWAPSPGQPADPLAELAIRYFTSHGPATERDFGWWSGLTLSEIRAAIERAGPALAAEDSGGQRHWEGAGPVAEAPLDGAWLLPAFDEYTVAYKDRSALLGGRALPASDVLNPVLLLDGRAAGVWKRTIAGGRVKIVLAPFERLSGRDRDRLDVAAERYAAFLGLPADITLGGAADVRRQRRD